MNDSFLSLIDSASSILILLPDKPVFDQVAAGLSLYLSLHDRKPVAVSCSSPITVGFNRLIGVNKITTEFGDKNLVVKFPNYDGRNIERVKADLEGTEFVMTVVPKDGFASPTEDQISLLYSGVSADLIILVGGENDDSFSTLSKKELESARIIHIGTRAMASDRGIMSFAKPGSSVSEVVAGLIKESQLPMDVDCSTNLLMGIEDGSSNFASFEVTPDTFEVFAYLLRSGGQRSPRIKLSPANFPPGSIPGVRPEPIVEKIEEKEETVENPPSDWLQPKVFKGTSVS